MGSGSLFPSLTHCALLALTIVATLDTLTRQRVGVKVSASQTQRAILLGTTCSVCQVVQ